MLTFTIRFSFSIFLQSLLPVNEYARQQLNNCRYLPIGAGHGNEFVKKSAIKKCKYYKNFIL